MTLQPTGDNLILEIEIKQKEEKSSGGLILINEGTEQSLRTDMANVVAVGEGRMLNNGQLLKPSVHVGDKVLYNKYAGTEIQVENKKYLILKETDILAIVK